MDNLVNIYEAIINTSNQIVQDESGWKKKLGGAKNFICTPDLIHWTFGKSVGMNGKYHRDGGDAKKKLRTLGFVDILKLEKNENQIKIVDAFLKWADSIDYFPLRNKFETDQKNNKRFELLVHKDVLFQLDSNYTKGKPVSESISTQQIYDEGFRKQISHEITIRNNKLIQDAKKEYGTTCYACGFNFKDKYGEHGNDFIEIHHLILISSGQRDSTIEDVRPVCSNCHRILHRGSKLLTIEELKQIIEENMKTNKK